MRMIVNSSPLIFLSKLDKLELLTKIYEEVLTTVEVRDEILEGVKFGYQDGMIFKKFLEERKIQIIKTNQTPITGLGKGESSVLKNAVAQQTSLVCLDDYAAIKMAKYLQLQIISTPFVLLEGVKKGHIKKEEFIELFDKIIDKFDYRISPVLYRKIIQGLEKI